MVLRITCPCGTPYSLGEHLAGRTFKCTQCGRVLKVGQPKSTSQSGVASGSGPTPSGTGQAPPARPPSQRLAGAPPGPPSAPDPAAMEWSSDWLQRKDAPGLAAASGSGSGPARPPAQALDLADDDEDQGGDEGEDEDRLQQSMESAEREPKRGRSGRNSGRKPGQSSASGRLSARGSAAGKQRGTSGRSKPASSGEHAQDCPVCGTTIARVARECPSCGTRLRGPSVGERVAAGWQPVAKGIASLAVAIGLSLVIYNAATKDNRPPRTPGPNRPNQVAHGNDPQPEQPKPPGPKPGDPPAKPPQPDPRQPDPRQPDPQRPDDPPPDDPPDDPPPPTKPPRDKPPRDKPPPDEPPPDEPPPQDEAVVIPSGPLEADLRRLRDATNAKEVEAALAAVVAKPEAKAALEEAAKSLDKGFRLRVHRARLRLGDEAARRAAILASLEQDQGAALAFTAYAALALDAKGLEPNLRAIPNDERGALARAVVAGALGERVEGDLDGASQGLRVLDAEARQFLAPLFVLGGDSGELSGAIEALTHPNEWVQKVARAALMLAAGKAGPGPDASSDAWASWARDYKAIRDMLVALCTEPPSGTGDHSVSANALTNLCQRGPEALKALPTFVNDPAARNVFAGQALGRLLPRIAGPQDAPLVESVLDALGAGSSYRGGTWIVRGALLACDKAVARAAAGAMARGALKLDEAEWLPNLVEVPASSDLKELRDWVESLEGDQLRQGRTALAALRDPELVDVLLQLPRPSVDWRIPLVARLGSSKLERALIKVAEVGNAAGTPGFPDRVTALSMLADAGTESAAAGLVKLIDGADVQRALRRIGTASQAAKLRSMVTDPQKCSRDVLDAYADMAGPAAAATLAKRAETKDSLGVRAKELLIQVGESEQGRQAAREPLEAWVSADPKNRDTSPALSAVEGLARCGKPKDSELLLSVLRETQNVSSIRELMIMSVGRLGANPQASDLLRGYIYTGVKERGYVSLALARMEREAPTPQTVEKMVTLVNDEKFSGTQGIDCQVLAGLCLLDPEQAKPALAKVRELQIKQPGSGVTLLSFGMTLVGDETHVGQLSRHPNEQIRQNVARGVAWAAVYAAQSGAWIKAPPLLEELRADTDPLVRIYAAIAAGFLKADGAAADLGLALTLPDKLIDGVESQRELPYLASRFEDAPLRVVLWGALAHLTGAEVPTWRKGLGMGRVLEITRTLRKR